MRFRILVAALAVCACASPAWAAYGYSVWGTFKYAPGFDHFDYVNPAAFLGGVLCLVL